MIYGFIISAGNQSRFKMELPKSLVDVHGKSLLFRNVEIMKKYCDEIYVVCSFNNEKFFTEERLNGAKKIVIESGKGSGDAVMKALNTVNVTNDDTCFILWGDALQKPKIYQTLIKEYAGISLVPCVYETNPYVQLVQDGNKLTAKFSKFNEKITAGYHDLSLFYFNARDLKTKLNKFKDKIWDKQTNNYIHIHGNEMELLDVFNETNIKANIVEFKHYKDFAFNTVEQLNDLIKDLDIK